MQRRERYSHGKKEPQVRWYVQQLRKLMSAYRRVNPGSAVWPYQANEEGTSHAKSAALSALGQEEGGKTGGAAEGGRRSGSDLGNGEVSTEDSADDSAETGQGWVIVDIGGGRGDLAINLARLLPEVEVDMLY